MDKRKTLILGASIVAVAMVITMASTGGDILNAVADHTTYSMTLNADNKITSGGARVLESGIGSAHTDSSDASISFDYVDLYNTSAAFATFKSGGSIANRDIIHGLQSISVTSSTADWSFDVYYSYNSTFPESPQATINGESNSLSLDSITPNYFKLVASSSSNIKVDSISLTYDCSGILNAVNVSSSDAMMGSVSGSGVYCAGDEVNLVATPNTGYEFVGWYNGTALVSSSSDYAFTMGVGSINWVGKFKISSYQVTVSANDLSMGSVSGGGNYEYKSNVTIIAAPNTGYSFEGWYESTDAEYSNKISSLGTYSFEMPGNPVSYKALFKAIKYSVSLSSNDETKGKVSGGGEYAYKATVTLTATPKTGYDFVGWYDGDTLISNKTAYQFTMPRNNLAYVGKFTEHVYSLYLSVDNVSCGTVSGSGRYAYKSSVTITATPSDHYQFIGWYSGDDLISSETTYKFSMPHENVSYVAKFEGDKYNVILHHENYDGDVVGSVTGDGEYSYGDKVTVEGIGGTGWGFVEWQDINMNTVSTSTTHSFTMGASNVELWGMFDVGYTLTVISKHDDRGTVTGSGTFVKGRSVTIKASPIGQCEFLGWYELDAKISDESEYMFDMPSNDVIYVAAFKRETMSTGAIIEYGSYPQSDVTDESIVAELDSAAGTLPTASSSGSWISYKYHISSSCTTDFMWYQDIDLSGFKYRGVYFTSYRPETTEGSSSPSYSYQDDNGYLTGTTYWFKFEPIEWHVMEDVESGIKVVSKNILDSQQYYYDNSSGVNYRSTYDSSLTANVYSNNYLYSDIRGWLNTYFYNVSFSLKEKASIATPLIDNSANTTDYCYNMYACGNSRDKVYLLSYSDISKASYGFGSNESRKAFATDYAKCLGAFVNSLDGNSCWRLRSPISTDGVGVWVIDHDGDVWRNSVSNTYIGIRPALTLNLD